MRGKFGQNISEKKSNFLSIKIRMPKWEKPGEGDG
jgi:hypothetical protein